MDLFGHKQVILRWINSSETAEQLDLLHAFITGYVVPRFEKENEEIKDHEARKNASYELEASKTELYKAIIDRNLLLAGGLSS